MHGERPFLSQTREKIRQQGRGAATGKERELRCDFSVQAVATKTSSRVVPVAGSLDQSDLQYSFQSQVGKDSAQA